MANKGWDVVAVEPCDDLRNMAQQKYPDKCSITWVDDKLPELKKIRNLDYRFNLIVVSAVWMHLHESKREHAFRVLTDLLTPDGILVITLRQGINEKENRVRQFHKVSREELEHYARKRAVVPISSSTDPDKLNRDDVVWVTCVFQLPDDGTGSLPLLRHIIVNDNKAATYKLGLLRSLIKIAESCPGMVVNRTDDFVSIPFGLVALYWIKLYMPLVLKNNLIQAQRHKPYKQTGLGFAKQDHFYALSGFSTYDLRVGASFTKEQAFIIIGSLNDVCSTIKNMPAHFITYPGQAKQIFECEKNSVRKKQGNWQINKESLSQFGLFNIPTKLWTTMSNFACWLEPAIINEWVNLMIGYEIRYDRSVFDKAMMWEEGIRDTTLAKADTVIILDFETTGLSPDMGDRAIEIGAVRIDDGIITERFQELMNPGQRISSFIENYTGITNSMLENAPPCEDVMNDFSDFIDGYNLVAHNASFDKRFLDAELNNISRTYSGQFACSMLDELDEQYNLQSIPFTLIQQLTKIPKKSVRDFLENW